MTDQRVVKFGMVAFPDGTTVNVPPISGSVNGWVYKPDQLRTKQEIATGKNRSWDRGSGFHQAQEWMKEYFERQITSRDWLVPSAIEKDIEEPHTIGAGDSISVSFHNPPWGWVTLQFDILDPAASVYGRTTKSTDPLNLQYSIKMHELGIWYLTKQIGTVHNSFALAQSSTLSAKDEGVTREEIRGAVLNFINDPWREVRKNFRRVHPRVWGRTKEVLDVPDLTRLEYKVEANLEQRRFPDASVVTNTNGKSRLYQNGELERVLKDEVAWDELNQLLEAFRFMGYSLRVDTGWVHGQGQDMVRSIEVDVPGDDTKDNELGHNIMFDATTGEISVACGYARDEERWVDRQKRVASHEMDQLETDLFTEYTIDVE